MRIIWHVDGSSRSYRLNIPDEELEPYSYDAPARDRYISLCVQADTQVQLSFIWWVEEA